jgi:hypothetical protein
MATVATGCSSDLRDRDPVRPYSFVPVPAVPDRTRAVDAAWADGGVGPADGEYWATAARPGAAAGTVVFDLAQALFGPSCVAELGIDGCPDDYGVVPAPTGQLAAAVADLVTVTVVDGTRSNYAIDGAELARLVAGEPPADAAPDGFAYVPYPFLVTVEAGRVVQAEQIWVP